MKVLGGTLNKEDFESFCSLMTSGSYYNGDAWGISNGEKTFKNGKAFYDLKDYKNLYKKLFKDKDFVIGHNRFTTQGSSKNNDNNHPFESKNYLLVHNGVISNDKDLRDTKEIFYKGETDSIIILEYIQALKNMGKTTVEAIKKTAELLKGSFSVMLYDKVDKQIYYFKNSGTHFTFGLVYKGDKRILVGSTDEKNFTELYSCQDQIFDWNNYDHLLVKEAKSGYIYKITDKGIEELSTFKEKVVEKTLDYKATSYYSDGWENNMDLNDGAKEVADKLKEEGVNVTTRVNYVEKCVYFCPVHKLSEAEETLVFTLLANLAFWDEEEKAFCMCEEEVESYIEQYGDGYNNY